MPDFLNMLKQQEIDRKTQRSNNDEPNTITLTDEDIIQADKDTDNGVNGYKKTLEQKDPRSIDESGNLMTAEQEAMRDWNEDALPLSGRKNPLEDNPYTWTPEYTQRGFIEEAATSIVRGFGKHVIGGTGDILQLANAILPGFEIREGNMISRTLQEVGKEFEEEYKTFMPEELKDPSFSIATFTNPQFWSKHVAEYIPQLAEMILISRGMGGAAKGVAKRGVAGMAEGMSKEALEKYGKKAVLNQSERSLVGAAKNATELGGQGFKGIRSLFMTTEGTATQGFLNAAEGVGGGIGMNFLAGLQNSGQLVNEMKTIKDPDTGEFLYSDEELGQMAAHTMVENMKYLPIDMLSYGMVYGRNSGAFNKINPFKQMGKSKKFFNKAEQMRVAGLSFAQETSPIIKGLEKIMGKVGNTLEKGRKVGSALAKPMMEGIEEQFQETWEEWATKKAKAIVTGEPLTIDGKASGDGLVDYFTFFKSKENEATRAIAGALGFLGGSGGQIVEQFNKKAEEQFKNFNKLELFKNAATNEKAYEAQQGFIKQQIIDNAIDGNVNTDGWIDSLVGNGVITEEMGTEYKEYAKEVTLNNETAEHIGDLNVYGKVAYLSAKYNEANAIRDLNNAKETTALKLKALKDAYKDNLNDPNYKQKVKEAQEAYETVEEGLARRLATAKHSVLNILSKQKGEASNIKIVEDENGNRVAVGLTQEDLDNYYNKTDEEIFADARNKRITRKSKMDNISTSLKNIYNSVKESFAKKTKEEGETSTDEVSELTEESIDALTEDILNVGDQNIVIKDIKAMEGQQKTDAIAKANELIKAYNETLKKNAETKGEEPKGDEPKAGRFKKTAERPKRAIDAALEEVGYNEEGDPILETEKKIKAEIKGIDFSDEVKAKEAVDKLIAENKGVIGTLQTIENVSKENVADYLMELGKESVNEATESTEEKTEKKEEPKKKLTKEEKAKAKEEARKELDRLAKEEKKSKQDKEREDTKARNKWQRDAAAIFTSPGYAENYAKDVKSGKHTAEEIQDMYDSYLSSTLAEVKYGADTIVKQIALNQHLKRLYPNTGIQAYAMNNLYAAIGTNAMGYVVGSSIMIDEKVWHQDDIYMHEFSHIHYELSKNEPATIAIVNAALRNKALMQQIARDYSEHLVYTNDKGEFMSLFGLSEERIAEMRKQKGFRQADWKHMPVILDEAFAHYLEGPMSQKYSKYFTPNTELTRQFNSKKWWKFLKSRAVENKSTIHGIARTLNEGKPVSETDLNTFFMGNFVNALQGVDTSAKGRYKLTEQEAIVETNKNEDIIARLFEERKKAERDNKKALNDELNSRIDELQQLDPKEIVDDIEIIDNEEGDNDMFMDDREFRAIANNNVVMDLSTLWDKNFDTNTLKTNYILEAFVTQYNAAKTLEQQKKLDKIKADKTLKRSQQEVKSLIDAEILDTINLSKFKELMYDLIENNESPVDFIRLLESSEKLQITSFLKFLNENFSNPLTRLRTLHLMYGNSVQLNAIINNVDKQGKYSMVTAEGHADSKVVQATYKRLKNKNPEDIADLIEALKVMRGRTTPNEDTDRAMSVIVKFYAHDIDIANKILESGRLISNKSNKTLFETFKQDFNDLGIENYYKNAQPFIKMLVNSGKKYSSTSTVIGPTGNQATTRMFKSFLTKNIDKIIKDLQASEDTKKDLTVFMRKYTTSKSGSYNPLLHGLWKNYHENGSLPLLALDLGNQNEMLGNSKNYKDSTPQEQLLNELLQFSDSIANDNGNYFGSLNIFGDSSRRIVMSMPIIKGIFNDKTGKYSTIGKTHLDKMYAIYTRMSWNKSAFVKPEHQIEPMSKEAFEKGLMADNENLYEYFENNVDSLAKIETFSALYETKIDKETGEMVFLPKISKIGKKLIDTFNFNRVANTYYTHDMVSPGLMIDSLTKRHKGIIAPVIALDPNLRVEAIPAADEYKDTRPPRLKDESEEDYKERVDQWRADAILSNDGIQYILDIHAKAIENSNPDFNRGYKIFSHNVEDKNSYFKGETSQMKGYTTVLTLDEVTNGNQKHLKPYYDLLMSRYNKFVAAYEAKYKGEKYNPEFRLQTNIQEKREKYIPIITPVSAEKAGLFNIRELEGLQTKYTLADLASSPERMAEFDRLLDNMYYKNGEFEGLNGDNFGPQQIMDKEYLRATFSIQAISSIMHSRRTRSSYDKGIAIQEFLSKQKEVNLQRNIFSDLARFGLDEKGKVRDDYAYSTFILKLANKLKSDPYTLHALANGEMAYSPRVSEFALNTFAKSMIREGNNLSVPGTYGQTISDKGYQFTTTDKIEGFINRTGRDKYFPRLENEYINGTSALNFYSEEEYQSTDVNGKPITKTRTRPMEAILPDSQNDGKTRARNSFYSNDGTGGIQKAKNFLMSNLGIAEELGLTDTVGYKQVLNIQRTEEMLKKNAIYSKKESRPEDLIGTFIPGQLVMTTRIPHNGPAFMGVAEVVGFHTTGASNIIVPAEYTNIIGADFDGDALFVYKQGRRKDGSLDKRMNDGYGNWNKAFELMTEQWLSPDMRVTLTTALSFEGGTKNDIKEIKESISQEEQAFIKLIKKKFNAGEFNKAQYDEFIKTITYKEAEVIPFGSRHYIQQYNNSVTSKQTIGIAFNAHRALNILSTYQTRLINGISDENVPNAVSITINGKYGSVDSEGIGITKFFDDPNKTGKNSRIHISTILANIVMDSAKNGHADALNLNVNSIMSAVVLSNLGFSIKEIGYLLNHPMAKEFISKGDAIKNSYIDSGGQSKAIRDLNKKYSKAYLYNNPSEFKVNVDPTSSTYRSEDNNMEVLRLMNYLSKVNSDLSTITNITSGHNNIERNSFALENDVKAFKDLITNKKVDNHGKGNSSTLFFNYQPMLDKNGQILRDENGKIIYDKTKTVIQNSPELNHYVKVAEIFGGHQKQLSLISNDAVQNILTKLKTVVRGENLTSRELKHFTQRLLPMVYSRMLGMNNVTTEEIKEIFQMKEEVAESLGGTIEEGEYEHNFMVPSENYYVLPLSEILKKYKKELDEIVYYEDETNVLKKDTELTRSRFFHQGVIISEDEIVLHPQINQKHFSQEYIDKIKDEFSQLPLKLQHQLILYDLIKHGWSGEQSMYPIFPKDITSYITHQAEEFQKNNKSFGEEITDKAFRIIQDLETSNEKNFLPKVWLDGNFEVFQQDSKSHRELYKALASNSNLVDRIVGRVPFRVDVRFINAKGVKTNQVIEVTPLGGYITLEDDINDKSIAAAKRRNSWKTIGGALITKHTEGKNAKKIFRKAPVNNLLEVVFEQVPQNAHLVAIHDESTDKNKLKLLVMNKTAREKDALEIAEKKKLKPGRFFKQDIHNYTGDEELTMSELLDAYEYKRALTELQEAALLNNYRADFKIVKDNKANYTPEKVKKFKDEKLIEEYERWGRLDAYAAAAIMVPILDELVARNINEQSKLTKIKEGVDDISVMKAYWQSNNIDSTHPATQYIQREIETEFKSFMKERKTYLSRINKVTEELYAEKLGYRPSKFGLIKKVQMAVKLMFKNRAQIYNHLYGELIKKDERTKPDGTKQKRWVLESESVLQEKLRSGKISQAEYNFAEMFREIVAELDNHALEPGEKKGGVPHIAMGRFEAFSRKGLLGVLTNSVPLDQKVYDVQMYYEGELMTFKEIEDTFRQDVPNSWKTSIEYIKMRRKAQRLLKTKKNEDGSIFRHSNVFNHTMLSDGMIDNFANGGWVSADAMLSMDLNKAISDFTHSKLFMSGNKNFKGFLGLQAKVDALFLHNMRKGFDNQNKFVRGVYKEYFLKAKKLNPRTSGDQVMDAIIKGNLLYIMGWKLLIKGKGLYAIGNVLIGKYNNIKNQGGVAWLRGEKRYWGIGEQGIQNRKAMGVLKTLNFMDMNFYDDVNLSASSGLDSIFSDLALLPMRQSENWIQGAHFLGMLTEEQWNRFDENGNYKPGETEITNQELVKIENTVKNSHGKGYTPTDQRLIQRYSWGRAIMQFSRFIPTMIYDRFAKEDVNIYGQKHIGSLRAVYDMVTKFTSGELPLSEMKSYRESLDPEIRARFDSGLKGMAMVSLAILVGQTTDNGYATELAGDANYLVNTSKLEYKLMPSAVRTIIDLLSAINPFRGGSE